MSIAVTGTILTLLRFDSWHALLHTRFGVLLCVKIALFLVMATTALLVTFVIGPRLGKQRVRGPHPGRGDFTPALGQAPHGVEKLAAFPEVGTLVPSTETGRPPHERGFFFMACLNLGIVAAVLLVITLWRM